MIRKGDQFTVNKEIQSVFLNSVKDEHIITGNLKDHYMILPASGKKITIEFTSTLEHDPTTLPF